MSETLRHHPMRPPLPEPITNVSHTSSHEPVTHAYRSWLLCALMTGCAREVTSLSDVVDAEAAEVAPAGDTVASPDAPDAPFAHPAALNIDCGFQIPRIDVLVVSLTLPAGATHACLDANHDYAPESLQLIFDPPAAGVGSVPLAIAGYFYACSDTLPCAERGTGTVTFDRFDPTAATATGSYDITLDTGVHFAGSFAATQCHQTPACG